MMNHKSTWWKWKIRSKDGSYSTGGSSYSTISFALAAAMLSVLNKSDEIEKIEILPAEI